MPSNSKTSEIHQTPVTEEWINELWYTFTTEYCKTMKINKLQLRSTTWMTNGRSKATEYIKYDFIYIKFPNTQH